MNGALKNDTDLEERVTFLEFQMVNVNEELVTITEDLIDVENRVVNVEGQITVVLADQVIQDERLLELETDAESIAVAIVGLDNSINTLETVDVALNNSIQDLDSRVSTLEELNTTIVDLSTQLERLEQDGTFAFHAFLGTYTSLPEEAVVVFPNINVNIGNGYDGSTGQFTVPPGGDGLYYLYAHFLFNRGKLVWIRMQVNDLDLCVAFEDGVNAPSYGGGSCGAVVPLQEGSLTMIRRFKGQISFKTNNLVMLVFCTGYSAKNFDFVRTLFLLFLFVGDVVHMRVTNTPDDTPLYSHGSPASSFSGIRIAPL